MKERELVKSFVFSLITFGIYKIYWQASMTREFANELGEGRNIYLDIIFMVVTFNIYTVYLMWKSTIYIKKIAVNRLEYTDDLTEFSIIAIFLSIFGWFPYILQDRMNTFVLAGDN